jgi:hypothetical protein
MHHASNAGAASEAVQFATVHNAIKPPGQLGVKGGIGLAFSEEDRIGILKPT